jgi:predicted lactoylglutathione lyase
LRKKLIFAEKKKVMQALRNIYTVINNQIIIDLPETFKHKSVEVIILPINEFVSLEKKETENKKDKLEKLLSISVWNENEIQNIIDSQNIMNQWKIEKF